MTTPTSAVEAALPVSPSVSRTRTPGRGLLWLGLAVPIVGLVGWIAQLWLRHLTMPWYLPCAGTVGVLLLVAALWKARSIWRVLALIVIGLLTVGEWTLVLGLGLPPYEGPVTVDKPFPAFTTLKGDGTQFTQRDLQGDQNTVLVGFRGRW